MDRHSFSFTKCSFILLLLSICISANAQFDAQISQYMMIPGYYNPGGICEGEEMTIALSTRQQWVSIENAPSTFILHAALPKIINNRPNGFGLVMMKESIGLFNNQILQLQYAWKRNIYGGTLSVGLQGGLLQQTFDASGIHIPTSDYHNSSDISLPTGNLEALIPDFSAGVWYRRSQLYAGISASHLLESKINLKAGKEASDSSGYTTYATRTYYLTSGYNIVMANPLYTLQPSFLLKTDIKAWQTDISVKLWYKERFWGLIGWRPEDAIIISAGIKLPQGLTIGYSYDVSIQALSSASGGSHELFLGFVKKIDTASTSKKQKSVRIL